MIYECFKITNYFIIHFFEFFQLRRSSAEGVLYKIIDNKSVDKLIDIKRDQFDNREQKNSAKNKDLSYAQIFIDVHDLGRRITLHSSFNEFLSHIPDGKWESRVYLARIDDLPIGKGYGDLNKWDMALETGFIDGLNSERAYNC